MRAIDPGAQAAQDQTNETVTEETGATELVQEETSEGAGALVD